MVAGLARTWRFRVTGQPYLDELRRGNQPFIYALWHAEILPLIWYHRGTAATLLVSAHRDGGVLAEAAEAWGFTLIRGSTTRGGMMAMRGMLRTLRDGGDVAVTPDGPRGPARQIKPGIVRAARRLGSPILPVRAQTSRAWRLGSWDRFLVPQPFAIVNIDYGAPVHPGPDDRTATADLQTALNDNGTGRC